MAQHQRYDKQKKRIRQKRNAEKAQAHKQKAAKPA
jgi:hypothetical protein